MPWSVILDVAIGVSLIFLLLSLIASSVQEIIAGLLVWRGTYLSKGIDVMLDNRPTACFRFAGTADWLRAHFTRRAGVTVAEETRRRLAAQGERSGALPDHAETVLLRVQDVQRHPLLRSSSADLPSYVPARNFALAFCEVLRGDLDAPVFAQVETTVAALPHGNLRTTLTAFVHDAGGDIEVFRKHIETWFDDAMDRVSGFYKRLTQYSMLFIGLIMAVSMNVDSLHIVKVLWETPSMRAVLVAQASRTENPADDQGRTIDKALERLKRFEDAQFPAGWPHAPEPDWRAYVMHAAPGWLITAIGISLGAPFWFSLLQSFMNLRNAGTKPKRSDDPSPPERR